MQLLKNLSFRIPCNSKITWPFSQGDPGAQMTLKLWTTPAFGDRSGDQQWGRFWQEGLGGSGEVEGGSIREARKGRGGISQGSLPPSETICNRNRLPFNLLGRAVFQFLGAQCAAEKCHFSLKTHLKRCRSRWVPLQTLLTCVFLWY